MIFLTWELKQTYIFALALASARTNWTLLKTGMLKDYFWSRNQTNPSQSLPGFHKGMPAVLCLACFIWSFRFFKKSKKSIKVQPEFVSHECVLWSLSTMSCAFKRLLNIVSSVAKIYCRLTIRLNIITISVLCNHRTGVEYNMLENEQTNNVALTY